MKGRHDVCAAHVTNTRAGRVSAHREFGTAELAAQNLVILLRFDGWPEDEESTVRRLIGGETLGHKNFAYRVEEL